MATPTRRTCRGLIICLLLFACALPATAVAQTASGRSIRSRLATRIDVVDLDLTPARAAIQWWSRATKIPTVVNWRAIENDGLDPEAPITIQLRGVPARDVLTMIVKQWSVSEPMIVLPGPYYIELMTKSRALRRTELRIYDVGDLLHVIPDFRGAPSFDLNSALSNTSSGGSGGSSNRSGSGSGGGGGGGSGGSVNVFNTDGDREDEEHRTRTERGEDIAELIRSTIEPDIWIANGGEHASIRYFDGRLIVKAPRFVHERIGTPVGRPSGGDRRAVRTRSQPRTYHRGRSARVYRPRPKHGSVSAVHRFRSSPVAGVAKNF